MVGSADTSPAHRDDDIWSRVVALHARVEHRLAAVLQRRHGLGLSEYRALGHLTAAASGELRMQELADRIGLNQSSVTRLASRLNAAGFTYRDVCPDDKRGIYLVLTGAGRTRYTEARSTYQRALIEVLDEVTASVPELAPAVAALRAAGS
jgi:Transcriptional regulators